jgi:peptidyl-tRNA hydrolase, PTH1 family
VILVVGLGNPGPRYADTRHNAGFMVVDALALGSGRVAEFRARFDGEYAECELGAERVGLLKPMTFMNESGRSVRAASSFFELPPEAILVVHDELDLAFGELRLKLGGGDGGHRGLRSISADLATPAYGRLRLGIGRPAPDFEGDVADFVLQAFALEERTALGNVLGRASEAVKLVASDGLSRAMNRTNQRMVR